jgi:hypothetical protein
MRTKLDTSQRKTKATINKNQHTGAGSLFLGRWCLLPKNVIYHSEMNLVCRESKREIGCHVCLHPDCRVQQQSAAEESFPRRTLDRT